jgi:cytochrome bd ubiquinol oxidase subunit II
MSVLSHEPLCIIWFMLLGVLLGGYAVLDGFDLGVGILHPFVPRNDRERRLALNSIGPLWDGNEVWLVTFGGAMFAMFPLVYASIFSGFYTAFMLLLFALILRAVSMEFRSKRKAALWRTVWDSAFFLGSSLAALLFGVAVGNVMAGIDLNSSGDFEHGILSQLHPFALLVGLLTVVLFGLHGAIYLYLKTENDFQRRLEPVIWRCFGLFLILYLFTTMFALVSYPHLLHGFRRFPWLWIVPMLHVLAIANIPRCLYRKEPGLAFISSSCNILALVALIGIGLFPNLVYSPNFPAHSLNVYNASSSVRTLQIGLLIVVLGMPFVLAYTAVIYWTFRGKVEIGTESY